jgi:hypothetical protein
MQEMVFSGFCIFHLFDYYQFINIEIKEAAMAVNVLAVIFLQIISS